ncbi:hypothetical protein [Rhodococcus sp. NPDC060176]|uniref:hypothetical protein n=1 Tax=Rhodococcus sp. NPDC060176 TaxID=3347062 RepID=UPI00364B29E2
MGSFLHRVEISIMSSLTKNLTDRQKEILHWIGDGCPEMDWSGSSHKTTARALAGRQLVRISRSNGIWSPSLTDAGLYYLDHGTFPAGHGLSKRQRDRLGKGQPIDGSTPVAERKREAVSAPKTEAVGTENALSDADHGATRTPPAVAPSGAKRSAKLSLAKRAEALIDALQLDPASGLGRTSRSYDDGHDPSEDERIMRKIRDLDLLPSGRRIRSDYWHARHSWVIEVVGPPPWHSSALSTSTRKRLQLPPHPVVTEVLEKKTLSDVDATERACYLLSALAAESEIRGRHVSAIEPRTWQGRPEGTDRGQLSIKIRHSLFSIELIQTIDRREYTPTEADIRHEIRTGYKRWQKWVDVPLDKFTLRLHFGRDRRDHLDWVDDGQTVLEDLLPFVMEQIEERTVAADLAREAELRRLEEQQRRDEIAEVKALEQWAEDVRAEVLSEQVRNWQAVRELDQYLEALTDHVNGIEDLTARASAREWLDWARNRRVELDPFNRAISMPRIPAPGYSDLSELKRRFGGS